MPGFQWNSNDLEKFLVYFYRNDDDITVTKIMKKNRFREGGRRPSHQDYRYLMQMAVKEKKARVTKGFFVKEDSYTIRLVSEDFPFVDPCLPKEFYGIISTFNPDLGIFSFLSSKDLLIKIYPEICPWGKKHDAIWDEIYVYWLYMRNALFKYKYSGGCLGTLPDSINRKEFALRLQWIICQYKALVIYLQYHPIERHVFKFDTQDGDEILLRWTILEEFFCYLLNTHANTDFATVFLKPGSRKILPSTAVKCIRELRDYKKGKAPIYKHDSFAKRYREAFGDDLWDYKIATSEYHYFSSGTWFRQTLRDIFRDSKDSTKKALVEKALEEWSHAEDQWDLYRQNRFKQYT